MRVEKDQIRALLVLVLLVGAFLGGVWYPIRARQQQIAVEIDAIEQANQTDRTTTVGLPALGERIVELERTVGSMNKVVPRETELASLLRQWSTELETQQVDNQDIQTKPIVHGADYNLIPIEMRFRGSFMSAFRFLRHVEGLNRLIRISELEVRGNPDRPQEPLVIRIKLATFTMPRTGEQ
jgi:Tfp pilus assembly protein PilO